jgi:hypothetical protein
MALRRRLSPGLPLSDAIASLLYHLRTIKTLQRNLKFPLVFAMFFVILHLWNFLQLFIY